MNISHFIGKCILTEPKLLIKWKRIVLFRTIRAAIDDEKIKDKFSETDRETLTKLCDDTLAWLDSSPNAGKEDFEAKKKEVEEVANPIMQKMYADATGGAGGMPGMPPGGMPGAPGSMPEAPPEASEPVVEEVD